MKKDMNVTGRAMTDDEILARLLYRDGLMLVIDKPAGLPVHRGPRNSYDKSGAVVEDSFDALRFGLPRPPVLAHRLDRDTSGCLVLGRHRKATAMLGLLFKHGKIDKTYWAVVEGGPQENEGEIDIPLGRLDDERGWWQKPDPNGLPSLTKWKVLGRDDGHDMAGAGTHHRTDASVARTLPGGGLADCRRQYLWNRAAHRRHHAAPACARDRGAAVEEQAAGARRRAGARTYARATEGLRMEWRRNLRQPAGAHRRWRR